ncbi:DUF6160 family protein [Alcanivorax quisquiliarum]|uniref:DUF6160 domain-containing protein n=1 Tax=Alcanivorax quisquiliarum TaxID=2933565 RepID=A0ABT0E463_9GAMM|nr:DUF6160 family protein [Alcanivorax quisquiliarum]MCK0536412.1 hypothetical protein [Alcanivorax quisquiliarum]
MKAFRKLALVSAIATLPATGFAMQAMDDAALSGVTGQDGISIIMDLDQITLNVGIEDTDGFQTGVDVDNDPVFTDPGLLLLTDLVIDGGLRIDLDSGTRGGDGVLRVGVNVDQLKIATGDIHVMPGTDGNDLEAGMANLNTQVGQADGNTRILDSMDINIDDFSMEIELGAGASDFLNITAGQIGTLGISNFKLNDLSGGVVGGAIGIDEIEITGVNLTGTTGSLTDNGLELALGAGMSGIEIAMDRVSLNANAGANQAYLGNVYISGLDLGGTVVSINGK